jgi:glutamine cyclotransferase
MKKLYIVGILLVIVVLAGSVIMYVLLRGSSQSNTTESRYTVEIINTYPHDTNSFTEGLLFNDGFLYEGTGVNGNSKLLKIDLQTGDALQSYSLPANYFGEGITIIDDKVIELTWQQHIGFVYEKNTFKLLGNFTYSTEGWGLTTDGQRLIMSDGTANLYFLDPATFNVTGSVQVHDFSGPVTQLNELEYVKGDIYANIFEQKQIAIINPATGLVKGWIDLSSLHDPSESVNRNNNVLNGIAYDAGGDRLFVTGKCWTQLFEVKLVPH